MGGSVGPGLCDFSRDEGEKGAKPAEGGDGVSFGQLLLGNKPAVVRSCMCWLL